MEFQYHSTLQDELFLARRLYARRWAYWLPLMVLGPSIVLIASYSLGWGSAHPALGTLGMRLLFAVDVLLFLILLALPWLIKALAVRWARRRAGSAVSLMITPEGLVRQAGGHELCVEWPRVHDIELDRDYLLFWLSSTRLIAVPRRIWSEREDVFVCHDQSAAWRRSALKRRALAKAHELRPSRRAAS